MGYDLRATPARQQRAAVAAGQSSSSSSMDLDPKKPPTKECTICRDDKPPTSFPSSPPTSRCTHKPTICTTCLEKHIEAEVNSKSNATEIKCPVVQCRIQLGHDEIQAVATVEVFQQYDQLLLKKALRELEDFRWCKKADCGSGQEHLGGTVSPTTSPGMPASPVKNSTKPSTTNASKQPKPTSTGAPKPALGVGGPSKRLGGAII
ncbi:hypothetical protein HK102_002650 [Quaeritorhiza haematococci]|nr:hypothetical protein HK102_002650 [Quaeritorhiza haematococci]